MKSAYFAAPALLIGLAAAVAGTPEEDYVAARDAATAKIKKIEAKNPDADVSKINKSALAALEKRLQAIIGPVAIKPYPEKGRMEYDSLSEGEFGADGLDGLRFGKDGEGPQLVVTTDGLLETWLKRPREWGTTKGKRPSIDEALANTEFYTFAVGQDAALTKTAEIPIAKPEGATFAVALLGGWAQDDGPNPQQQIVLAVRREGKVYIASESAKAYKLIPACDAGWKAAEEKANAIFKKYQASGAKDEKIYDSYTDTQSKGYADYLACYRQRAPKEAFFPALVKEAQEIADRFGGK